MPVNVPWGGFCHIFEKTFAIGRQTIAEKIIGRAVLSVVIGRGITILILTLKVDIRAQVKIQPAIPIVIGRGHAGERSLGWILKFESRRVVLRSSAVVDEEQRT